ncbi:hypothetical protein [Sandaracinus amylolyticus]|uniref:Uncharacterized protein n=1 Tax=Sandaracinus amylolyticus TaxID=927083 RepID=A0A0F6W1B2_9BACT|nr:hypothetical protein [Sandaracinus amylolyticus]AKF04880.1 hypothetical protein DB32_002029 [Sandaracinus amylolyticus]
MSARSIGVVLAGVGLFGASMSLACGPSLDPPSVVDRTRIVAARVSVVDAPEIAQPAPGDAIVIEWITIRPAGPEEIAATLVACAPLPGSTGAPACTPGTIVVLPPRAPSIEPLRTELVVPEGAGRELLITGAVCVGGGTPALVDTGDVPECEGGPEGERAELVVLNVPLATGEAANRHPSIADEAWTLAGDAWDPPSAEPPLDGCAELEIPQIDSSERADRTITITASDADRETYVAVEGDPPANVDKREVLQISHFATAGRFERTFSAVDDTTTQDPAIEIDWALPEIDEVPESGLLVRFTAVVRDGRGGVDVSERVACVVP